MDGFAVVARVSDLHPRTEGTDRRKIFDDKADGLGSRGKATIAEPRPRTALAETTDQGRLFCLRRLNCFCLDQTYAAPRKSLSVIGRRL